jgi:hypothetical protein
MPLFWVAFALVVLGAVAFIGLVRRAVRWGNEFTELQQFGVETTGTVLRKSAFNAKPGPARFLRYEYRDQFGVPHSRKVPVTQAVWETLQEGGPIEIVYSQRRAKVSAPKYLMDVAKSSKTTITINARE